MIGHSLDASQTIPAAQFFCSIKRDAVRIEIGLKPVDGLRKGKPRSGSLRARPAASRTDNSLHKRGYVIKEESPQALRWSPTILPRHALIRAATPRERKDIFADMDKKRRADLSQGGSVLIQYRLSGSFAAPEFP
jgi:hypothetical protein